MQAARTLVVFSAFAAVVASSVARPARAAEPKGRTKVFLGKNAVVKEAGEPTPLVGAGPTTIVTGRDTTAGPREMFENGQITLAGKALAEYLGKITGRQCSVVAGGVAVPLSDGGFEDPPAGPGPKPEWPALAGGWFSYSNKPTAATAKVVTEGAHGGKAAVLVRGAVPLGFMAGAMRPLTLASGEKHRISFWYRTKFPGKGIAVAAVTKVEPKVEIALEPSADWKRAEIPFTASVGEAALVLGLKESNDESEVWFDDVALEKVIEPAADGKDGGRIHVGSLSKATAEFPELEKADDHGFVIARKGSDLHIVGKCGTGTLYGVWFFLYNHAGLRIVLPGEIGEVYEKQPALSIPKDLYVFNPGPDFQLRIISQPAFDRLSWLQDATGTERFLYHHAFGRVLPSEKFGQSRPELYPILGGKRFIPPAGAKATSWQPTFSEPKLVDHVLEHADEAFTQNPTLRSISVMPNDGDGYSELDTTDTKGAKDGLDGWRRHYYTFVNAVAKGMAGKWPGRYVAFLSYRALETPPEFKLADNVMLFLFSKTGNIQETMAEWKDKVSNVGVYQWLYGAGWLYPCHGPKTIQDYLRYLHGIGGRAFKGEAYMGFAQDGARMWVTSNLLWNVDADADALLMDYLDACYGSKAAAAMRKFHARVEAMAERRRTPTQFNLSRLNAGPYQFQHVTEDDFRVLDAAIEEATRAVEGESNRTRLDYTRKCHEFCRLYWNAWSAFKGCEAMFAKGVANEAATRAAFAQSAAFSQAVNAIGPYQVANLASLPEAIASAGSHEYWLGDGGFKWRDKHDVIAQGFDAITAARLKTDPVAAVDAFWKDAGRREPAIELFTNRQRWSLLPKDTPLENLLSNGGFEEPVAADDAGQKEVLEKFRKWEYRFTDFNDLRYNATPARDWVSFDRQGIDFKAERVENVGREGRASMLLSGAAFKGGVLHHFVPPESRGRYRISLWYKTEGTIGAGICGVSSSKVWGFETQYRVFAAAADWRRLEFEFTANSPPAEAPCVAGIYLLNSKPDARVWIDDVRIELLSPAGVASGASGR